MDDEKPNTSHLVLKPKVIIPTDAPSRPGDGTAISAQLIHSQNKAAEEWSRSRRKKGAPLPLAPAEPALAPIFKPKELSPLDPPSKPGDEEAIRVADILLQNRIAEERSGWGRIKRWSKRKSRRGRDFIILVGGFDLGIVLLMRLMPSGVTLIYGTAAITLVTSMFGWILFFVMDDY